MKPPIEEKIIPPYNQCINTISAFLSNGLEDEARDKIKEYKLKLDIRNGKIVELSDSTDAWLSRFITVNSRMIELKNEVRKLSLVDDAVLICGPTGTGKELIARALHGSKEGSFMAINCGGLPEHLVESELFGHVQGAFTGAIAHKNGLMKLAGKGTLFLDELGELPLAAQAKLLRAIQSKEIRKVGGDIHEKIYCRIVCATNKDLTQMVLEQKFRIDLLARLATMELDTTALQERPEDIVPILETIDGGQDFLKVMNGKHITNTPYNVRSLEQYVRRFVVLGKLPV